MALTKISGEVIQTPVNVGVVTATRIDGDINGNVNSTGVSTFSTIKVGTAVTISAGSVTATSLSGNLTGNVVGNVTGNATGLSGTPNITVGAITAASAVITGNVSVAGTVTYEDTTNVDSIGVVTARNGIIVSGGSVGILTASPRATLQVGSATTQSVFITSAGNVGLASTNPRVSLDASQETDAIALPQGTTAQRPSGNAPYIRYNTTNSALEFYNGTDWVEIISDYFPTGSVILG
jgi:hypothetical protein